MRHYSPESIIDKKNYTSKSDVYSFGCMLYEVIHMKPFNFDKSVKESCENV